MGTVFILLVVANAFSVSFSTRNGWESGREWLLKQRDSDWGWGELTSEVVLALRLTSRPSTPLAPDDLLSLKELHVRILARRCRAGEGKGHEHPYMDALALLSTCKDPKNFYGWNLLEKREREKSGYSSALRVLARCLAGDVVSLRHAHRLLRNLTAERSLHKIDTLGMSSLALNCMRRKFPSGSLDDRSREIAAALASSQRQTDASFDSDPITTALAIHALRCSPPVDWNESGAIRFLLDGEDDKEEGKFGGVWETTWVLPAIATNSCVIDVFQRVCPGPGDSSDPPLRLASDAGGAKTQQDSLEIRVNVTVWIGADISRRFSRIVQVPANSSVFQILLAAAAADSRFQFSADVYPWGHIVHTIDGVKFKDEGYWYWLLYTIPGPPEPLNPPNNTFIAAGGVDDVKPNDGDNILFWYRNL